MNSYIGHTLQLSGVVEYRLTGGKGDGMRMLRVKNGKGLEFEISLDRCADIVTLNLDGINMGYFAPCGYVHPSYYNNRGSEFLKSFTAGFFTTCGLTAVGSPCVDEGEELPLHGTISHTPCEQFSVRETDESIVIEATIRDASIFSHQLMLMRTYKVSKLENTVTLQDCIVNIGAKESPLLLLYHCNMGYPLLSEHAEVVIPADSVAPRNAHAAEDIENCLRMEAPQADYEERCYYHNIKGKNGLGCCGLYNPSIDKGVSICYHKDTLGYFTQWKMMGSGDYVLGLEPGNCTPDGRDVMRKNGTLTMLQPEEEYHTELKFKFYRDAQRFKEEVSCW